MRCQRRIFTRSMLWICLLVSLLAACAGRQAAPSTPSPAPVSTATITPPAANITRLDAPTITPTAKITQTPGAPEIRTSPVRPPSGWTIFSNPDYIRGVAVRGRALWAATLGGVVSWDLDTLVPTLFTTRDGLAEIQGNDIVFCPMPEERILVAHPSGILSAYDMTLKKWSRIPITFEDGSTLHGVSTMYCDAPNRRLMVGSADGLGILDERTGRWRHIGAAAGLKIKTIQAIDVVGQSIWIAAGDQGAFMIIGNTIFPFNSSSGFPTGSVNDLVVAPDASVWFGYSTGLVHYQDKKWSFYSSQSPSGIPFLSVDRVAVGQNKQIWIGSSTGGACPFNSVTLFCSTVYPGLTGSPVTSLAIDQNGTAYAGTDGGGILVMDPERVRHLVFGGQQLLSNEVLNIAESKDGKLWIATDHGINVMDPEKPQDPWQMIFPSRNQLIAPRVSGLLSTVQGIWFYYDQVAQATFFDGKNWLQLDALKGITGTVLDAAVDQRGYTWFATSQGIKVWDGVVMRSYAPPVEIPGNVFRALYKQGDGMYVGTDRGLLEYINYQWQIVLPDLSINTIAPDLAGGLLLGTDQGLVRFDGSQSYLWIINLGSEVISNPKVTSVAWDGNNHLWVGTDGSGLFNYDGSKWSRYNTASGLPTNHIRKVFKDHLGEIWIASVTDEGGGALVRYMP